LRAGGRWRHAEETKRQGLQEGFVEMAGDDAGNAEEQTDGGQRKGDRKAVEHE